MTTTPELPGKLDAATLDAAVAAVLSGPVNGPGGEVLDWHAVDWAAVENSVRRLRQRIFTASQAGDPARVRNLQKLMLRSLANTLASVRRVTEHNAGRLTPGVDGEVVVTSQAVNGHLVVPVGGRRGVPARGRENSPRVAVGVPRVSG